MNNSEPPIREVLCDANLSYMTKNKEDFLLTEYKVLHHEQNSYFVECCKMMWNENIQLYYLTSQYVCLSRICQQFDEKECFCILEELINILLLMKRTSFLNYRSVIINIDRIFIDLKTKKIKLIYLPFINRNYSDEMTFQKNLNSEMRRFIFNSRLNETEQGMDFLERISDKAISLEQIYIILKNRESMHELNEQSIAKLVSTDRETPLTFIVSKEEYLIGRKADCVDGCIAFNRSVGRIHCKIKKRNNGFFVEDLKSTNGTYLNNIQLRSNVEYPIVNGDILMISNSEFLIKIE